jgi:hypothetical protein
VKFMAVYIDDVSPASTVCPTAVHYALITLISQSHMKDAPL